MPYFALSAFIICLESVLFIFFEINRFSENMSDIESVIDKFSGFITKDQAEYILNGGQSNMKSKHRSDMSVREVLELIAAGVDNKSIQDSDADTVNTVSIKDQIYRIFNHNITRVGGKEIVRRIVVLGGEGSTIPLNLSEKLSRFVDLGAMERGDYVLVRNAFVDMQKSELRSLQNTSISRVTPSIMKVVTDYSSITEEMRGIDVLGKIIEIGPIKYVNRLGNRNQIAISSCTITDSRSSIEVSCWGSCAISTANLKINDTVKLEFCDARARDGKIQVYANDNSRIVSGDIFAKRHLGK